MPTDIKAIITAVDQTGPGFKSAQRNVKEFASESRRLAGLLAGVFGALSVTGIVAGLKSVTDEMDRVGKSAQKIGTTAEALSALEYAASLSDISVETLQKSLAKLALNLDDAKKGSGTAAEAFARLKIDPNQFSDPSDALKVIAEQFANLPDGVTKTAVAMQVFGKSGADLIPLLNSGASGIAEMEDEARRLGITFSTEAAKSAEEFNDNITRLQAGMRGLMIDTVSPLIPLLVELTRSFVGAGDGAEKSENKISGFAFAIKTAFEAIVVLGANVKFVFETIGVEISLRAAQVAALARGNLAEARAIGKLITAEGKKARSELDAFEQRILNPQRSRVAGREPSGTPIGDPINRQADAARKAAASKAAAEARREATALVKAQELLEKARIDAEAQGLDDSITSRREKLDQARKAELIDDAGFIAAKAALDEEGLRNDLAALQAQQAKLRDASTAAGSKASDRTQALAELVLVEARIESASQKILNLNQSATAELTALGVAKLRAQSEFIDGLEQEAFLSGLNNDERETALVLLEAEKLGITDVNRLLELQGQIRANANAKTAAEETKRQQDDLYKSVQDGVQRAFADGLNAIATGEGGIRGALKNIADTIRNAMSNALAGSLADGFLGLLGGKEGVLNIAGSLGFGGKKDGSSAASALYVRDVSAGGIAGAGTGEAGGLFSGLGETLSGLFNSIKSALSGLVSSIGNALSSLFSSSGGGGGSSAGSWISAIASIFGYAEGGFTGPGSKYQPAGVVHAGEYVFSADSVRRLGLGALDNLHRLAKGSMVPSMPRFGYAEGGAVNLPGAAAPVVNASTRIVNVFDMDSAMSNYLQTRSGERAILNIIQRNPGATGG